MSVTAAPEAILFFTPEWNGMHPGAWRYPGNPADGAMDYPHVERMVQRAEAAKLHGFFLADALGFRLEVGLDSLAATAAAARFEPFTLMSALARGTEHIGLLLTANTTYDEPYHIARRFASLDFLSSGRAGWNIVTGGFSSGARHFGRRANVAHDDRYAMAREFVDAVIGLWDEWGDDAFVRDQAAGVNFRTDRLSVYLSPSERYPIEGPLNIPRPPQGHPVLAQAGSSPSGIDFASRYAEVIFTLQADLPRARTFRGEVRNRAAALGRNPDHVKVLPSLTLVLAQTQELAAEKMATLNDLAGRQVGVELLSGFLETPLYVDDWDRPLPPVQETSTGTKTIQRFFVQQAEEHGYTVGELVPLALGFGSVITTPAGAADRIEEWISGGGADGFNITFGENGETMDLFLDQVLPELTRRGVFRDDYVGGTLRDELGLPRPAAAR